MLEYRKVRNRMPSIGTEIIIILALILINGLFAMSEMAIVAARRARLQQKAEEGNAGAARALELAGNPTRFLSTVQVGITLIGILTGAFGGATLAEQIGSQISQVEILAPYSKGIGVAIVVLAITYLSLVLGELVPKRLALNNAEKTAASLSGLMCVFSRLLTPAVSLLSASTEFVLKLIRVRPPGEPEVTEDEVRRMLLQGTQEGVFNQAESVIVERVFRFGDRNVSALMTPRPDIIYLEIDDPAEEIGRTIAQHTFAFFPVMQDTPDNVVGIVQARDLLLQRLDCGNYDLRAVMRPALFIPEATPALMLLERLKTEGAELAMVIDEYGGVLGLVSMTDVLESLVGEVAPPAAPDEAEVVRREDGSWLLDGMLPADELKDLLDLDALPQEAENSYATLGGMMMTRLGRIPVSGDHFVWDGYRFEVVDMDARRVDKVLVAKERSVNAEK